MATETTTKTEPEIQVTENDDGTIDVFDPSDTTTHADPGDGDEGEEGGEDAAPVHGRVAADDDDGPTEAEELKAAANDAAREAIRARRRAERKTRKVDAQERERNLRAQVQAAEAQTRALSERINLMERKTNGTELAQLDNALRQAQASVAHFKQLMADADTAGNPALRTEATEKWADARDRVNQLASIRHQVATPPQRQALPDPMLVMHANAFMSKNTWYDPKAKTADTAVVLALDKAVMDDGFQPTTEGYWQELQKRVDKYMPHLKGRTGNGGAGGDILGADVPRKPGKNVVTGSGRETAAGSATAGFKLSADRVKALKDAGMWENITERNAMIKDYREHDRRAAAANKS